MATKKEKVSDNELVIQALEFMPNRWADKVQEKLEVKYGEKIPVPTIRRAIDGNKVNGYMLIVTEFLKMAAEVKFEYEKAKLELTN
ncbi:MAG: hypothetical protein ACOYOV_09080 [Bacteroidales bacterium]